MATGAKPVFYQERKRLALVVVLAFLAGFIFYARTDIYVGGFHASLVIGAIYAVIIGVCALIVCILLPSMRFMIEAVAVSRLLLSVFVFAVPNIGYAILASPPVTALVTVVGGVAISRVIHGRIRRETHAGLKGSVIPSNLFKRIPVSVQGTQWQKRFVNWLEDAEPVPVRVAR